MSFRAVGGGLCVALFICFAGAPARAQTNSFEGQTIVEVQYSPSQPLDPADLAQLQPLKKGEPLHAADVARAIDGLFSSGRFQDIAVEAEPAEGGVIVRFVTTLTTFVGHVAVSGKVPAPPNRAQIINATPFNTGQAFRQEDVKTAENSISDLFKANGLYEAQVDSSVDPGPEAQLVVVTFKVKPGKRAHYEMPVINGDAKLPLKTIIKATGWRVIIIHRWRQVTDKLTRSGVMGVQNRYQKKNRLMAKVELEKLDYDAEHRRVQPVLNLDPGPKVELKAIEAKVSRRTLKKYVPVYDERAVDNDLLVEGVRNLKDYFQSQGYYDVDIDFRRQPLKDDTLEIDYVIARGQRYKLVKVDISGNKYFRSEEFRERMFMQPASFRMRHGRYSEAFRTKDAQNIESLYQSNGFRDVKVTATVERNYKGNAGDIAVAVNIDEGPQYFVDNLTIDGITALKESNIRNGLASEAGQPWADLNIAADRSYILTAYYSAGFPKATFAFTTEPAAEPHHVNLTYTVTEGERHYVRDVIVTGLRITRPSVVDRILDLKPGQPLSTTQVTEIQKRFYDLGIFASVDATVENPGTSEMHKYVLYDFQEANRYRVDVGVGAQIATFGPTNNNLRSPGGATGFSPEFSMDVTRLNFLGRGHEVSLRGDYSSIDTDVALSYFAPRFRNVNGQNLTVSLLYQDSRDVRTFSSVRKEASVQMSQKFSKSLNGFLRFSYSIDSVGNVVIPALLVPQLLQSQRVGMLAGNLVQDRRDNPADPHHGMYNTVDAGLASNWFGSQRSFARLLVRNATYYSINRNWVLARQTQFGIIEPYNVSSGLLAADSIPLPERFYGGGANTDRGFGFDQAGPRDIGISANGGVASQPTGFPLGGNALFFNTVELRFPFIGENIQGVLFEDMGNIFRDLGDISFRASQPSLQDFSYMVHAVGFGVRYKTPVGPIRLDLAYSINPPTFYGFNGTVQQLLACNPNLPPSQLPAVCTPVKQTLSHFQFFFSIGQTF